MSLFNAADLVQFAIRMEENGEAFYRESERLATKADAKQLFKRLADEEVAHHKTFKKMLSQLGETPTGETHEGEYLNYLRSYIDSKPIFKGDPSKGGNEMRAALDAAIQRELDAVLYYQELREHVSDQDGKILDDIIDEERNHFAELSQTRKRM